MTDYLWNFPTSGLALALEGLDALRTELDLPHGALPGNALGDRRDALGVIVTPPADSATPDRTVWIGRPGSAAASFTDLAGTTVEIPAKGDPAKYYMHIRTDKDVPGFDPAVYGLQPTDPPESAAVLGVWAGDEVPT